MSVNRSMLGFVGPKAHMCTQDAIIIALAATRSTDGSSTATPHEHDTLRLPPRAALAAG